MFDLTGKTALVTGATGGIGGDIARAMHAQGAHVVLSGTREEALKANRAAARPYGNQGADEYSQTPGFSVRELAAEAKARGEAK